MGHITTGISEGEGTYNLKVQKSAMGQIVNGTAKGEMMYSLRIQRRYDGSDRKWNSKGIKDVLAKDAEEVQWVRLRMARKREKGRTF